VDPVSFGQAVEVLVEVVLSVEDAVSPDHATGGGGGEGAVELCREDGNGPKGKPAQDQSLESASEFSPIPSGRGKEGFGGGFHVILHTIVNERDNITI